jgi:hypothetical protein
MSQVFNMGVRDGIDLRIRIAQFLEITKELFLKCRRAVVVPAVGSNPGLRGCQAKLEIMFPDNCPCRCSGDQLQDLEKHRMLVRAHSLHTSRIFQVPNVILCDRLKPPKKYLPGNCGLDPQADDTNRDSNTLMGKAGLEFVRRSGTYYLWVKEYKIRGSPGFQDVSQLDDPGALLSQ